MRTGEQRVPRSIWRRVLRQCYMPVVWWSIAALLALLPGVRSHVNGCVCVVVSMMVLALWVFAGGTTWVGDVIHRLARSVLTVFSH